MSPKQIAKVLDTHGDGTFLRSALSMIGQRRKIRQRSLRTMAMADDVTPWLRAQILRLQADCPDLAIVAGIREWFLHHKPAGGQNPRCVSCPHCFGDHDGCTRATPKCAASKGGAS